MALTIALVLRTSKVRASDGTAPVYVRVTANRKSTFKTTGVRVKPAHWNDRTRRVRRTDPLGTSKNDRLDAALREASDRAGLAKTAGQARRMLASERGSFTGLFRKHVAGLDADGRVWDARKYRTTLRKLTDAMGDVDAEAFDADTLRAFERHLRAKTNNGPNTVRKELSRLRTVTRMAVRAGLLAVNPFDRFDMPPQSAVTRRKLTLREMDALAALPLELGTPERWARDAFVFSFYAAGMRFGDVCTLSRANVVPDGRDGQAGFRVRYRMMKTGTDLDLPLPPAALELIGAHASDDEAPAALVFPMLRGKRVTGMDGRPDPVRLRKAISSSNASANRMLKRLARRASVERPDEVTFHVARHSYADLARSRSGDVYAVSKALGHANLTITETYLRSFDRDATDRLQDGLWGSADTRTKP